MKYDKYLNKEELSIGSWYRGFCRGSFVALWDGGQFLIIKQEFAFVMDKRLHFDDVKDKGIDGFVPLEIIEDFRSDNYRELRDFKRNIGYK